MMSWSWNKKRKKLRFCCSSDSKENFMVWSRSVSCMMTAFALIIGCHCSSLSSCCQSSGHKWQIISDVEQHHPCVLGKIVLFYYLYLYQCQFCHCANTLVAKCIGLIRLICLSEKYEIWIAAIRRVQSFFLKQEIFAQILRIYSI